MEFSHAFSPFSLVSISCHPSLSRCYRVHLSEREYYDVEERHRVKMIEHETTQIVVHDLDKYYDALDKALLRYHGMKINVIYQYNEIR